MMRISLFLFFVLSSAIAWSQTNSLYKEPYRPQFHFSPPKNWCNDPNGLVYNNGEYHLFYQYNPFGNVWGHMTWAHAVSKDLVHWKQLPIAIPEENKIMIFSGSAVVDENNTSGFAKKTGQPPMAAVYTGHFIADTSKPDDYLQAQYIAYSLDKGRTWKKWEGNPILDLHKKDFRDPKVFWYAPQKKWIMALVLPHEHIVQLYSSPDLKQWIHLSDFGPAGDINEIWECPDLLQVPVTGSPGKFKWVLLNSQQTTTQYFAGEFDGTRFNNENPSTKIYRPDYGPDYYAAVTYNHLPASHSPVLLGWVNNWTYAKDIPTTPWKGAMSLPRTMGVKKINGEWILLQQPAAGISALREKLFGLKNTEIKGSKRLPVKSQQFEMMLTLPLASSTHAGVRIAAGNDTYFEIGYEAVNNRVYIDRSKTPNRGFNKIFNESTAYAEAILPEKKNTVRLHIFYDHSIVEVFVNDGEAVLTAQLFPGEKDNGIELFSKGGSTKLLSLNFWEMRSVW